MSAAVIHADTWGTEAGDLAQQQRRLREGAATALQRDPAEVCALLYRSTLDGVRGWRASVATRDGRVYARCWASKPENAAQLLVSTLSGEG